MVNVLNGTEFNYDEFSDTNDDIFCALADLHRGKPNKNQLKKIVPEIIKGYYYRQLRSTYTFDFTLIND